MASRKPITQAAGVLEQLQAVDTLTVGDYDLPNTISNDGKVLITVGGAAVWNYSAHTDLTGITTDQHHAILHTHNGADGTGVVEHDDTANGTIAAHDTGATGTELDTLTDGSNADALHDHAAPTINHTNLTNVTTDQHHAILHTHNGADGTGVVEHDDTANGTIAAHDTSAAGSELDTLTDGSNADALHIHSVTEATGNTTYYLATTGNDSTGNGSSGSPWKTVNKAIQEIYSQSWGLEDIATISIADGTYEFSETLIKNGSASISIVSTNVALTGTIVDIVSSSALGGDWYTVRLDITSTSGFSTGQLISVEGISGSRSFLNGTWLITAVNDATDLTISLWSRTRTPVTGAISVPFTTARVVFHSVDTTMFVIKASDVGFSGISFVNNSGTVEVALDVQGSHRISIDSECSFNGFISAGILLQDSALVFDNVFFSDCYFGIELRDLSSAIGTALTVSAAQDGIIAYGSMFWAITSTFSSNINRGVNGNQYSYVTVTSSIITDNVTGVRINAVSVGVVTLTTYNYNGTDLSPAANTEGNRNSYMQA